MTTDLANTTIEALSPMQDLSFDAVIPGKTLVGAQ